MELLIAKRNKATHYTVAGLLCLAPVLFIFQGLDFTDMGYVLVNSRDTLADPGNLPAGSSATFLSMLINGLWMKISSPLGLLGARAGVVVVYWLIFFMLWKMLKERISGGQLLVWILLTFLFIHRPPGWISYNTMTTFFVLASLCVFYRGHKSGENWLFCLAGALCALAFFARLPNILMIGFCLLPLIVQLAASSEEGSWKRALTHSGLFLAGYAGAVVGVLIVMAATGYLEYYWQGIQEIRTIGSHSEDTHSVWNLLKLFVKDHVRVLGLALPLLLLGGCVAFVGPRLPRLLRLLLAATCAFCFLMAGWFFYLKSLVIQDGLVGILYLYLLMRIWYAWSKQDENTLFLHLAALCMLIMAPLGSDNGIANARHGLWLAMPLFLNDLAHLKNLDLPSGWARVFEGEETKSALWFKGLVITAILIIGLAGAYRYTYRDTSDRLAMRYSIGHPKLHGIFTTKERAAVVRELLDELKSQVRPGDFLLGFHTVSTLYYLTETRPYLYNSWPFLYQPEQLRRTLEKAVRERPTLPVAVLSKYSLQNFEWPKEKFTNTSDRYQANLRIMSNFLRENAYQKSWENSIFEIWLPTAPSQAKRLKFNLHTRLSG